MERLSPLTRTRRVPWPIPMAPFLLQHALEGQAVLPAMVALGHLASAVVRYGSSTGPLLVRRARFDRFLPIPREAGELDTLIEMTPTEGGGVDATLMRRKVSVRTSVARTLVYATARFRSEAWGKGEDEAGDGMLEVERPAPDRFDVPAQRLYRELVPFGSAFHNLVDAVTLAPHGARALVQAPLVPAPVPDDSPLGSPFPMDAAFHAACAWGQRYAGCVAIPVGFASYRVARPIRAGEVCRCEVRPRDPMAMVFDILIRNADGGLREAMQGLQMQDVSRGRRRPPDWVRAGRTA